MQKNMQNKNFSEAIKAAPWKGMLCILVLGVLVVLGFSQLRKTYQLGLPPYTENSLKYKLYLVKNVPPEVIERGMIVQFTSDKMDLYIKHGTNIGKVVSGIPGDIVEIKDGTTYVNGEYIGKVLNLPKLGRPVSSFDRREIVPEGKYFVSGTHRLSYDSRYWGFLDRSEITGSAIGLF